MKRWLLALGLLLGMGTAAASPETGHWPARPSEVATTASQGAGRDGVCAETREPERPPGNPEESQDNKADEDYRAPTGPGRQPKRPVLPPVDPDEGEFLDGDGWDVESL